MAAPPPVPALPDAERRTSYAIVAGIGPYDVGFAIYGDGTDYGAWLQVWLSGTQLVAGVDWTLALTSGTLATAARPLTNAQVTLTVASTGTLQIVGARRPRRLTQFTENRGVAARDLNQEETDQIAEVREAWDMRSRLLQGVPGDLFSPFAPGSRANTVIGFDSDRNLTLLSLLPPNINVTAGAVFNTRALAAAAHIAPGTQFVITAGLAAVGDLGGAFYVTAGGSTPGGFQSADGQWWMPALIEPNAKQFAAKGNGVTLDHTAIQAGVNGMLDASALDLSAASAGYLVNSPITISKTFSIRGQTANPFGSTGSVILTQAGYTGNVFVVNEQSCAQFSDISITAQAPRTAGAGIVLESLSAGSNTYSKIDRCYFQDQFVAISGDNCEFVQISNTTFSLPTNGTGIVLANTVNSDGGDHIIDNCNFLAQGVAGTTNFLWHSGGGLRYSNNKNLGGTVGFQLRATNGVPFISGLALITNNSFDSQTDYCIRFQAANAGDSFFQTIIHGNQFGGTQSGYAIEIAGANANNFSQALIIGNSFVPNAANQNAIHIGASTQIIIGPNHIEGPASTGTAITIDATAVRCVVAWPVITNSGTPVSNSSASSFGAYFDGTLKQSVFFGSASIVSDGGFTSSHATQGIGYAAGAGGTVTQATNKSTGVTLNKVSGQITMNAAALAAGAIVSFVLTDSAIGATDLLILNHVSGGTPGSYHLNGRITAGGSGAIDVTNISAGSLSEAIVIRFALIKGATS